MDKLEKTCEFCKGKMSVSKHELKRGKGRFCSRSCASRHGHEIKPYSVRLEINKQKRKIRLMKKLMLSFALLLMVSCVCSLESKAQHPDVVYRATFRHCVIFIAQTGDFGRWCFSHLGAGDEMVPQHFDDELYVDTNGKLHLPSGGSLKNAMTEEDMTEQFRFEESLDFSDFID